MIALLLALLLFLALALLQYRRRNRPRFFCRPRRPLHPQPTSHAFSPKKPAWVRREVTADGHSVGKTFVANTLKHNAAQVLLLRRKLKNRKRRQGPRNLTWALDLTFLRDGAPPVLGVLDHGTRSLLALRELPLRSTTGALRILLDLIDCFGRPRSLRTDNEAIFTSRLLRLALWILGIEHQAIDPFCPWQNGRIERLFATLKQRLRLWWQEAGVPSDPQADLDVFRTWYNHARPHQSLEGLTPAMAWAGVRTARTLRFFDAWEGILTGFVVT